MLKNKITHKELLTQENKEVLEKWNIITENPLAYFDPNVTVKCSGGLSAER